jgi:hypothetical protein
MEKLDRSKSKAKRKLNKETQAWKSRTYREVHVSRGQILDLLRKRGNKRKIKANRREVREKLRGW